MRHFPLVLLLLALAAGCSAAASSRAGAAPNAQGGRAPRAVPERLILTEVADSGALARALAAEPFVGAGSDTALLSVSYDSTGALVSVGFFHPAASEEQAERLGAIIKGLLAAAARPKAHAWALVIRGDVPRVLPFEPSGEAAPRMLNRSELARALQALAARPELRNREAQVWLYVGMDGAVKNARIVRTSGSVEADRALLEVARQARFEPARLDRFVVPVWIQFPLAIRKAEPASPPRTGPPD